MYAVIYMKRGSLLASFLPGIAHFHMEISGYSESSAVAWFQWTSCYVAALSPLFASLLLCFGESTVSELSSSCAVHCLLQLPGAAEGLGALEVDESAAVSGS